MRETQISVRDVGQSLRNTSYSVLVISFLVCFKRKMKEKKKKRTSIGTHLTSTNCMIFYYTGENYSISETWLMRPHTSQPPLHTHKNVIISVLSLVWPRSILQNVRPVSPACLGKTPQNLWRTSCGIWCLVWCAFLFCWAHSTKLHYSSDSTTRLYFLPCYKWRW